MSLGLPISAFVLAGGRSSRMGRDKALVRLCGKTLAEHAAGKLSRITFDVSLLAGEAPGKPELTALGRCVLDSHPGLGPLGGIEAALTDARHEWVLVYPVDVPMLPLAVLAHWAAGIVHESAELPVKISMFEDAGRPQPALLMLHRAMLSFVQQAILAGQLRLGVVLRRAAEEIGAQLGVSADKVLRVNPARSILDGEGTSLAQLPALSDGQKASAEYWFANLNYPEDLAWAEEHCELLDI